MERVHKGGKVLVAPRHSLSHCEDPSQTCAFPPDDSERDLCNGRPISGLTTLRNGTIAVFRGQCWPGQLYRVPPNATGSTFHRWISSCNLFLSGHYFWFLDSDRVPGPARGITQVWGIPSPIDTVFTRCNCQGKTYIFKVFYFILWATQQMSQFDLVGTGAF